MRHLLALLALVIVAGCAPRTYTLECLGPGTGMTPEQCETVAELTVLEAPGRRIGELRLVAVEPLVCSRRLARASFTPKAALGDACWGVTLEYAGADLHRLAIQMDDGGIHIFP